jgi:plastocyanin
LKAREKTPVSVLLSMQEAGRTGAEMRRILVATTALALAIVAAACGGESSTPSSPSPAPTATPFTITVTQQSGAQSFSPNPALAGGQMVVFRNADSIVHRVVLNDGSVDTGDMAPGATSQAVRMPSTGTNYHCSLHPAMVGAVSPTAGGPPPVCEGIYC